MRALFAFVSLLLLNLTSSSQNTDLPSPSANIQTIPSGSYVIAMDNTNQLNNGSDFNLKSYGLVVHLLNNNKKVKWVITAGKVKDATDISVNAVKIKPVAGVTAAYNFKAGPFVIFAADTLGVAALIDGFNSGISNTNDKVKVYKTTASTTADIRYDLTGFIPKAAILDDGASTAIHIAYMTACNITSANYKVAVGTDLLTDCYTFASEAHNTNTGTTVDNAIASIHRFAEFGGNFLAQCHSIDNYENNSLGHFQTSGNITIENYGGGTNITYGNPDLSFSQYEGAYSISKGGSLKNWSMPANSGINNFHKHAKAIGDTTVIGASVSKLKTGAGGLVFYIGNHRFDDALTTLSSINGLRMYMNAFLTPVSIANSCTVGEHYMYPLSMTVLSFNGALDQSRAKLNWEVYENETIRYFEVQSSVDRFHFVTSGKINGSLEPGKATYSFQEGIPAGIIYYRLMIKSQDNIVRYSKMIVLDNRSPETNGIILVSNPLVEDKLSFIFKSAVNEKASLKITDLSGRLVFTQALDLRNGKNYYQVLLPSALTDGIYVAELKTGMGRFTQKFIK